MGDSFKLHKVFNYLKNNCSSEEVIFLSKHSVKKKEEMWNNQWGCGKNSMPFAHGTSNSRGAHIAFREGLNYKDLSSCLNDNGRYVILKVEIHSSPFISINYYATNEEGHQVQILTEIGHILEKIELKEHTQLNWGGEFNSFDCKLDADGGNPKLKVQSIAKLVSMMFKNTRRWWRTILFILNIHVIISSEHLVLFCTSMLVQMAPPIGNS